MYNITIEVDSTVPYIVIWKDSRPLRAILHHRVKDYVLDDATLIFPHPIKEESFSLLSLGKTKDEILALFDALSLLVALRGLS